MRQANSRNRKANGTARLLHGPRTCPSADSNAAFTLIECLAVLAALGLLVCVALPALAGSRNDAQRLVCMNNLRQIGQAWSGWRNEHGDEMPPLVEYQEGGMRNSPLRQNTWAHYSLLSNHLATPKALGCPADHGLTSAEDWSRRPGRGLMGPTGLGDRAVSYFMGMHGTQGYPGELVGGDRLFRASSGRVLSENCSMGVQALRPDKSNSSWDQERGHQGMGNLLLLEGQVLSTTDGQFQGYLASPKSHFQEHVIVPARL